MILFRIRRYGSSEWTELRILNSLESEDDSDMEEDLSGRVESILDIDGLHVQRLSDEGKWEDL